VRRARRRPAAAGAATRKCVCGRALPRRVHRAPWPTPHARTPARPRLAAPRAPPLPPVAGAPVRLPWTNGGVANTSDEVKGGCRRRVGDVHQPGARVSDQRTGAVGLVDDRVPRGCLYPVRDPDHLRRLLLQQLPVVCVPAVLCARRQLCRPLPVRSMPPLLAERAAHLPMYVHQQCMHAVALMCV
jgi:hypothetical protein